MADVKRRVVQKTTVREELEYWNAIHIFRKLIIYYRDKLRYKEKDLQGLEAQDFAMTVLEKIVSGRRSWESSPRTCFLNFVYDVAWDEYAHFIRDNKNRVFVSWEIGIEKASYQTQQDKFIGF